VLAMEPDRIRRELVRASYITLSVRGYSRRHFKNMSCILGVYNITYILIICSYAAVNFSNFWYSGLLEVLLCNCLFVLVFFRPANIQKKEN